MASAAYDRLPSIEVFGAALLDTLDLDPLYVALARHSYSTTPNLGTDDWFLPHRFLLAYLCFYNAGAAAFIAQVDAGHFWDRMFDAALNTPQRPPPLTAGPRWPRGAERRHFRGELAKTSVASLYKEHPLCPGELINGLPVRGPAAATIGAVREWPGFGPWVAFKAADMLDRVLRAELEFDESILMYKQPHEAAKALYLELHPEGFCGVDPIKHVLGYLQQTFGDRLAPPREDRPIGLPELETILCKWKSHLNGHYPVGKDTLEIREALSTWSAASRYARELLDLMP